MAVTSKQFEIPVGSHTDEEFDQLEARILDEVRDGQAERKRRPILETENEKRMLYGAEVAQERNDLRKENEALGELLSGLVDIELERDTTKAALDVAMRENQRLTKLLEESE